MSPIIDHQRRMVEAGRIRAGDTGPKGEPRKLDKWRLTSKDRTRLEAAAILWGGAVKEWEGRAGEFELYTDTSELPIMLLPETEPSLYYELWTKGGCQRRCDGQTELISGGPCLCGDERECKPHLRFPVLLPDLTGIGSWLVQSTGWNAANEIPGAMALLSQATARGVLMPARLRLEQRVQVKNGKTHRFAVPVVDVDVSFRELLSLGGENRSALPAGYIPIEDNGGTAGISLQEGLALAESQTLTRTSRSATAIPEIDAGIPFGTGPVPVPDEPGASALSPSEPTSEPVDAPAPTGNTVAASTRDKPMTKAQSDKLGIYVRWLREDTQQIATHDLYRWVAKHRNVELVLMTDLTLDAYDNEGVLHWGPLLKTLTRAEANALIDALIAKYGEAPTKAPA